MAMPVGMTSHFVSLGQQVDQIIPHKERPRRALGTEKTQSSVVGSRNSILRQNFAPGQQGRARKVVERERDQRDSGADRKRLSEKSPTDVPLIIVVKSRPRIRLCHV